MTDLPTFAAAVARMRTAQKRYFKSRSGLTLSEAKQAEADVDAQLAQLAPTNVAVTAEIATQTTLFQSG